MFPASSPWKWVDPKKRWLSTPNKQCDPPKIPFQSEVYSGEMICITPSYKIQWPSAKLVGNTVGFLAGYWALVSRPKEALGRVYYSRSPIHYLAALTEQYSARESIIKNGSRLRSYREALEKERRLCLEQLWSLASWATAFPESLSLSLLLES